jgi:MFS family permease
MGGKPAQPDNPALPLRLRGLTLIGALALLAAGLGLFFAPAVARPLWPWQIGPFSGFFWGAVCLSALAALALLLYDARWWPARLVLPMLVVFSGSVLIVSLLNLQRFHFDRWTAWLWFALLLVLPGVAAEYLWRHREQPPPEAYPTPGAWSKLLQVLGLVLGLYGLGLFLLPPLFGAFWPWPVDSFNGQLYSVVFTTSAVGAIGLCQWAAPVERLALGVCYAVLGLFTLFSVMIADATQPRVAWDAIGVWVWLGLFAALFVIGLALIWWSSSPTQGET